MKRELAIVTVTTPEPRLMPYDYEPHVVSSILPEAYITDAERRIAPPCALPGCRCLFRLRGDVCGACSATPTLRPGRHCPFFKVRADARDAEEIMELAMEYGLTDEEIRIQHRFPENEIKKARRRFRAEHADDELGEYQD